MRNLAPDITRQRLLIEGLFQTEINESKISLYLLDVAEYLNLRTYGNPWNSADYFRVVYYPKIEPHSDVNDEYESYSGYDIPILDEMSLSFSLERDN